MNVRLHTRLEEQAGHGALASLVLLSGTVRGTDRDQLPGKEPTVTISSRQKQLRITLKIGSVNYRRYTAVIQTASGESVQAFQTLQPVRSAGHSIFTLQVPAAKLESRQYQVILHGLSDIGEAVELSNELFRVEKR
ncbi:MAG: hypothetical protein ACREEM_04390 [Blastocatellia bacterium]